MFKRFLLVLATALLMPFAASASPITYLFSGEASGSLGGTAFSNQSFVIAAQADTANIGPWCCSNRQNTSLSANISIGSLGTVSFLGATHTWVADNCCMGFGANLGLNYLNLNNTGGIIGTYNLATPFGPIHDPFASTQGQFTNVATSGGALSIFQVSNVHFQAVAVPEPGTYALMALGLGAVGFIARRRRG